MADYYLEQYKHRPLPEEYAMSAFLKTSGDTLGTVHILLDGGFDVWRNGSCIGTFDSVRQAGEKLSKLEDEELKARRNPAQQAAE